MVGPLSLQVETGEPEGERHGRSRGANRDTFSFADNEDFPAERGQSGHTVSRK
jgi:hypothetical protein